MRLICLVAGLLLAFPAPQPDRAPLVPVGVWYDGGPNAERDLATIRSLGFNSVRFRSRGRGADDALIALARQAGLHVFVQGDGAPQAVDLPAGGRTGGSGSVSSADVRLWGWDAIARGARAIFFSSWSAMLAADGSIAPRAHAAGEFAGIISRNAALFAALRPRPAAAPQVRVDAAAQEVEAHFLESPAALLLIAINRADRAQKVTLRFPPDTPEAIWQNLETGAAVSFVMGPDGPSLAHPFLARDVIVLVRAKRLQ